MTTVAHLAEIVTRTESGVGQIGRGQDNLLFRVGGICRPRRGGSWRALRQSPSAHVCLPRKAAPQGEKSKRLASCRLREGPHRLHTCPSISTVRARALELSHHLPLPWNLHGLSSHWHDGNEQPSPVALLPSSHCSPNSSTLLPHTGNWHDGNEQPSPLTVLPSSHSSPWSMIPSPHSAGLIADDSKTALATTTSTTTATLLSIR